MFKRYLKFFIDDLINVIKNIKLILTNQYKNYFIKFAKIKKNVA